MLVAAHLLSMKCENDCGVAVMVIAVWTVDEVAVLWFCCNWAEGTFMCQTVGCVWCQWADWIGAALDLRACLLVSVLHNSVISLLTIYVNKVFSYI